MGMMRHVGTAAGIGVLLALAMACGEASNAGNASSTGGDAAQPDGAATGDGATTDGRRTLASCTTNIAADVPAFYRTYFKCVTVTKTADAVVVETESLPPHLSYYYGSADPNFEPFDTTRGAQYQPNPNLLAKKAIRITIPDAPVAKEGLVVNAALVDGIVMSSTEEYGLGPVGVALDSVALFNPLARPGDDIENEKYTFDAYDAHPAPDGTYHYHRGSKGPLEVVAAAGVSGVEAYGVMCDGTVVLGCTELDGSPPPAGLDAQGGHVGDLKDGAGTVHFVGRYHTHVCGASATGRKYTPEVQFYKTCGR